MKKFLESVRATPYPTQCPPTPFTQSLTSPQRNLGLGLEHASKHELLAMVESKMHEPTSTGFDDPQEWSSEDLKEYLREVNLSLRNVLHPQTLLEMAVLTWCGCVVEQPCGWSQRLAHGAVGHGGGEDACAAVKGGAHPAGTREVRIRSTTGYLG